MIRRGMPLLGKAVSGPPHCPPGPRSGCSWCRTGATPVPGQHRGHGEDVDPVHGKNPKLTAQLEAYAEWGRDISTLLEKKYAPASLLQGIGI